MFRLPVTLVLVLVFLAACGPPSADVVVQRMDVVVTVLDDGTAQIEERLVARFGSVPSTTFRRHSPAWRHDGVSDISATLDGAPAAPGPALNHLRIEPGGALDVAWTFASTRESTRVFGLTYRARNVVAISGIRGTVSWQALPAGRTFDVSDASVTMHVPTAAILLQDPWVEEAGWHVTRLPLGLTATRSDIPRAETATAGLEFTIDHLQVARPLWQFNAQQAAEFMPAFVSAGLFILVIGAGVIVMLRFRYPAATVSPADPERLSSARDLRTTAWVVLASGIVAWVVVAIRLPHFGVWPLAIPLSMLLVGALFMMAAARMLYFARVRDGRTSV